MSDEIDIRVGLHFGTSFWDDGRRMSWPFVRLIVSQDTLTLALNSWLYKKTFHLPRAVIAPIEKRNVFLQRGILIKHHKADAPPYIHVVFLRNRDGWFKRLKKWLRASD